MLKKQELLDLIRFSWSTASVSGAPTNESWGDYADCKERFERRKWQDLSRDEVMRGRHCVNFLTLNAVLYFLPSFLLFSLEEKDFEFDISEAALLAIARLIEEESEISGIQILAVQEYLRFLAKNETLTGDARLLSLFRQLQLLAT